MHDEQLRARVHDLYSQGLSTNAITRALGVPRAQVAPLVREFGKQRTGPAAEPAVVGCWVSAGWSLGLTIHEGYDWPDRPEHGNEGSGLVGVLVAREHPRLRGDVTVCGYLVDTYCLGVKDALGPRPTGRNGLDRFVDRFFAVFDGSPVAAPIELARHLVWGAVAYARGLGLEPHPDFRRAAGHLGPLEGTSSIEFGYEGQPYYIQGPYDDADRILRTLERNVGLDNVHFTVSAPLELV